MGFVVAALSVVSSTLQQVLCRTLQQRSGLGFLEFLSHTAAAQVTVLHSWPHCSASSASSPLLFLTLHIPSSHLCIRMTVFHHLQDSSHPHPHITQFTPSSSIALVFATLTPPHPPLSPSPFPYMNISLPSSSFPLCAHTTLSAIDSSCRIPPTPISLLKTGSQMPCRLHVIYSSGLFSFIYTLYHIASWHICSFPPLCAHLLNNYFTRLLLQGVSLILIGPFVDYKISGLWLGDYRMTSLSLLAMMVSCMVAVGVNVSQYACLGRFQAATFQVWPHPQTGPISYKLCR